MPKRIELDRGLIKSLMVFGVVMDKIGDILGSGL